jgi:multisubunit Na+/H+ antiporter MnhB subunit
MRKLLIKKLLVISALIYVFLMFYISLYDIQTIKSEFIKKYYISNSLQETASKNFVTAIYLDYRLFDSIFEAGILLIATTGILFVSKNSSDIQ